MTRRYGRAPRNQRVYDAVPKNFGRNISILGALSWNVMDAVMTIEGAVDTAEFRAYATHVLAPTLRAGDVVVMDNLSVHKAADIEIAVHRSGRAIDLPAAVLAGLVADRALLIQAENLVTWHEGPDQGSA